MEILQISEDYISIDKGYSEVHLLGYLRAEMEDEKEIQEYYKKIINKKKTAKNRVKLTNKKRF